MKVIPIALEQHYKEDRLYLAQCFRLGLTNGTVMGFTSFDEDIIFAEEPNVVYRGLGGMTPSAIASTSAFDVDNLEVEGYLEDDRITDSDIKAGLYDYADVDIFEINWNDLPYSYGKVNDKRSGKLGEIRLERGKFIAEIRGLMQYFQNLVGTKFQGTCRANFGDAKCKVDLTPFTFTAVVQSVSFNKYLTLTGLTQEDGYFEGGKLIFTNGLNNTTVAEIKAWTLATQLLEIQLPANYVINPDDTVTLIKGCKKEIDYCLINNVHTGNKTRFFRGEPYIPQLQTLINQNRR